MTPAEHPIAYFALCTFITLAGSFIIGLLLMFLSMMAYVVMRFLGRMLHQLADTLSNASVLLYDMIDNYGGVLYGIYCVAVALVMTFIFTVFGGP